MPNEPARGVMPDEPAPGRDAQRIRPVVRAEGYIDPPSHFSWKQEGNRGPWAMLTLCFSCYLVSRLAGTNCIFIWHEARDEGGMRGTYLPLIPRPPPRPNLGRPVWRACCPRDHLGLEGKRLQLQPRSPWGVGVACRSLQATLSLELGLFQFKPRMSPHQREGEDTWYTDMCVHLACCLDTLEALTRPGSISIIIVQTMLGTWYSVHI